MMYYNPFSYCYLLSQIYRVKLYERIRVIGNSSFVEKVGYQRGIIFFTLVQTICILQREYTSA